MKRGTVLARWPPGDEIRLELYSTRRRLAGAHALLPTCLSRSRASPELPERGLFECDPLGGPGLSPFLFPGMGVHVAGRPPPSTSSSPRLWGGFGLFVRINCSVNELSWKP